MKDMEEETNSTRWVAIAPHQTHTFLSEEEAIDWIDDLWRIQPLLDKVQLMRVERYTSTIYRPRSLRQSKNRR